MQKNKENKSIDGVNILVVDDEKVMRSFISDALTDAGYKVEVASNGEEALSKIKHSPFEILLTDLMMPGMDGIEVIQKVKEVNSNVCAIVITGYPSIETAVEAMRKGAYDYIAKPFKLDELMIVVKRAIERQLLSQEKKMYKELSITDDLTEVYNHRYLQEILSREVERAKRYSHNISLVMVDLDDFKIYNDSNGHLKGEWSS